MSAGFARDTSEGCVLSVRVYPGARRDAVTGIHAEAVKIALTKPPVDGRANEALIEFIAEALHLPKARVAIATGAASRTKTLRVIGKSAAEVQAALLPAIDC